MTDWIETAHAVSGDVIVDAAVDAGDWDTAAMAILANPASVEFPQVVLDELGGIAFGRGRLDDRNARVVRTAVAVLDRRCGRV